MQELILLIHVFASIALIVLVLMQHGKGADVGAVLGSGAGASQTVFGSSGSTSFIVRLTVGIAVLFFITSLTLGYFAAHQAKGVDRIEVLAHKANDLHKGL
jgi:preprotein translocase subunit SecG